MALELVLALGSGPGYPRCHLTALQRSLYTLHPCELFGGGRKGRRIGRRGWMHSICFQKLPTYHT